MDFIWYLISLLLEFDVFAIVLTGLVGAVVAVIIYKTLMKLLDMFS